MNTVLKVNSVNAFALRSHSFILSRFFSFFWKVKSKFSFAVKNGELTVRLKKVMLIFSKKVNAINIKPPIIEFYGRKHIFFVNMNNGNLIVRMPTVLSETLG